MDGNLNVKISGVRREEWGNIHLKPKNVVENGFNSRAVLNDKIPVKSNKKWIKINFDWDFLM